MMKRAAFITRLILLMALGVAFVGVGIGMIVGPVIDGRLDLTDDWIETIATIALAMVIVYFGLEYLFAARRSMKRRRTSRRGVCRHCGYNLCGNPPGTYGCPECGWGRGA